MLTLKQIQTLIFVSNSLSGDKDSRHELYRLKLIAKDHAKDRYVTERGKVFLQMLTETPLPVEVKSPKYVDPRTVDKQPAVEKRYRIEYQVAGLAGSQWLSSRDYNKTYSEAEADEIVARRSKFFKVPYRKVEVQ